MAGAKTEAVQISDTDWMVIKKFKNGLVEKRLVKDKIDIWLIGNTGMRNPWRIPEGFKIYVESDQVGHIRTPTEQIAFKRLLAEKGVIGGDPNKDKDASITRKYRLVFGKYGFTYSEITSKDGFAQEELGPVDTITPLGMLFYNAKTRAMQQECFLRGLMVPMERIDARTSFSPFLWTLQIMLKLYDIVRDYRINFIEFAVCVQTSNPLSNISDVCNRILEIRNNRRNADDVEAFDEALIHDEWTHYCKDEKNFREYADMNIRYLKTTGLIKEAGNGITLDPQYLPLIHSISKKALSHKSLKDRYIELCNGAPLVIVPDEDEKKGTQYNIPAPQIAKAAERSVEYSAVKDGEE